MEFDVYAPCPCGSGKKLKFCCAPIVEDMAKVARLQAADQSRQAMAILEKLDKSHPQNPWVNTVFAEVLIGLQEPGQAKRAARRVAAEKRRLPPRQCHAWPLNALCGRLRGGTPGNSPRPAKMHHAFSAKRRRFSRGCGSRASGRTARDG